MLISSFFLFVWWWCSCIFSLYCILCLWMTLFSQTETFGGENKQNHLFCSIWALSMLWCQYFLLCGNSLLEGLYSSPQLCLRSQKAFSIKTRLNSSDGGPVLNCGKSSKQSVNFCSYKRGPRLTESPNFWLQSFFFFAEKQWCLLLHIYDHVSLYRHHRTCECGSGKVGKRTMRRN